ncbi:calcineurin-binding protein cabin-1-like [Haliotis rufescens]|uniref:calcineurin-binding protein cabin-1-like n=1 Tax=Haliotis rufescens TaxID=6454 RepID=UPI00201ECA3E|nr:calcineurin-binding protein cabin-1-like [Haliotis rufescens]
MFRIAALNESDSGDENTTLSQHAATTREAKEAEAFSLYSRALSLQREGDVTGAKQTFQDLVSHDFLIEAARIVEEEQDNVVHPGLQLLYSIHKNLAAIAADRGDLQTAMKSYLEAVKIDSSEVTVWYKIGTIGLKIHDYSLSRLAFEQGLQCNPNHWPCLDHVIPVSYALNDYWRCLYYIAKALEKDCHYEKGIALREEMFREQPSLRQDSKDMFVYCDPIIFTMKLDKADAEEYVEEALAMRRKNRELAKKPPPPVIKFPEKIESNTWKSVGEALIALYNHATRADPPMSLSMPVDMSEYKEQAGGDQEKDTSTESRSVNKDTVQMPETANDKETVASMDVDGPFDVVDGDIRPPPDKKKDDHEKEPDVKPDTQAPTEVLSDDVKVELSAMDTTELAALAMETVDTPVKVPPVKVPSVEVEMKVEMKEEVKEEVKAVLAEAMDDDAGDVYAISTGLDASPSQPHSQQAGEVSERTDTVVRCAVPVSEAIVVTVTNQSLRSVPGSQSLLVTSPLRATTATLSSSPVSSVSSSTVQASKSPISTVPGSIVSVLKSPTSMVTASTVQASKSPVSTVPGSIVPVLKSPTSMVTASTVPVSKSPISTVPGSIVPVLKSPTSMVTASTVQASKSPISTVPGSIVPVLKSPTSMVTASTVPVSKSPVSTVPGSIVQGSKSPISTVSGSAVPMSKSPISTMSGSIVPGSKSPISASDAAKTPIMRGMLGHPHVAPHTDDPHSHPTKPHPASAAQLFSTPKSSLLLTTAIPSELGIHVPNPMMRSPPLTSGLLSPVQLVASPRSHSAPVTPDILTRNPFPRSPPSRPLEATASKSQSLLTLALTQPPAAPHAYNYPLMLAGGDAPPTEIPVQISPTSKTLLSPVHVSYPLQTSTYASKMKQTSPIQTVPLQSTISRHLSTVQAIPLQAASSGAHSTLSPEDNQMIAQQAAAHTLIALAQMPTQLSPQRLTAAGGNLATNTLASFMAGGLMKQSSESVVSTPPFPLPAEVALQDHPNPVSRDLGRSQPGGRRGTKRKRVSIPIEDAGMKRRSARVRNTSRKKQEDSINMQELLYKFLPSSLLQVSDDEDDLTMEETDCSVTAMDSPSSRGAARRPSEGAPLESTEEREVKAFIQRGISNYGIIDLLFRYLTTLTDKHTMKWPEGLGEVFVQVYDKLRQHLTFPCVFGSAEDVDNEDICEYGRICLLWAELKLDHWLSIHSKPSGTSPRGGIQSILGEPATMEEFYREDLWYITTLAGSRCRMGEVWMEYAARVYWLKARFSMIQNDKDEADFCFDKLSYVMDCAKEEKDITSFKLQNCKVDDIISKDQVDKQQESLQRSQSLEETQKLYEAGSYDKVVEFLLQTFSQPRTAKKISEAGSSLPERHRQLMLLQDSLFKLKDYKKCLLWGEVSFNEALQCYRRASGQSRDEWLTTIRQIFDHINKVLDMDESILKSLPSSNTVRHTQNLIRMIELTMDSSDTSPEVPNTVVLSWILLSRLIKSEEAKLRSMLAPGEEGTNMDGAISSSLMLLNVAHEYLGRHSWCTKSDGALLLYFLNELEQEMKKPHFIREGLDMALEQCIFCLYGHPHKRGKAKHLQDHNAPPISFVWEKAGIVFDYFKPSTFPEYDSYKANTVSAEFENLLRRLFALVPSDVGAAKHHETVQNYIEGNTNTAPSSQTDSSILKGLYYLLGDYYFKNKETPKAIKFYMYDLGSNPTRLDSWAGLALARMSQLEQKLSSMELRMDISIHKKSIAALRCFRRAVEIDETQRNLWIEYGSLAYQLHSHASRQLKMRDWFPLYEELLGIVTDTKQEMLQIAQNCYWKASECEADGSEEEWLHHYMIGKVKEKKRCHPKEYLEHYRQAAIYLHEDEAFYPKKITYANSPPKLALEALEVFYRLHVAILKQLLKKDGMVDYELFQHYLTEAAESPFAKGKEKRHERRESHSNSMDESSSSNLTPPAYSQLKARPVYHMTPQDHTYSKQKSSVDGSDTSCDVVKEGQGSDSSHSKPAAVAAKEGQKSEDKSGKSEKEAESKPEAMEVSKDGDLLKIQRHVSTGFVPKDGDVTAGGAEQKSVGKELKSIPEEKRQKSDSQDIKADSAKSESDKVMPDGDKVMPGDDKVMPGDDKVMPGDDKVMPGDDKVTSGDDKVTSGDDKVTADKGKDASDPSETKQKDKDELNDSVLVLDPATGLMVPMLEDDMEVDDVLGSVVSDKSKAKTVEDLVKDPKPAASTPVLGKAPPVHDIDVIEISDDESSNPAKSTVSLSLKKPSDSCKDSETKVGPEAKKELFGKVKENSTSSKDSPKRETTKTEKSKPDDESLHDESSRLSDNSDESDSYQQDSLDTEILHTELIDKCVDALHLCVQRFPTHYKSLYRLAHVYMTSPYHKNLEYARDLLLGNNNWQNLSHMPGPGLFAERRTANFFQGIWKIPIEEIDRSGSFASHIHRSVRLLLDILTEQKDIMMLYHIHIQLNRSLDTGKKYLRDQERNCFAKSSFKAIQEAVTEELKHWDRKKPRDKQLDYLMTVYRVWHHSSHKLNAFVDGCTDLFVKVYKLVQKDYIDSSQPILEQATKFCQQRSAMNRPSSQSSDANKSANLSTAGFLSPPTNKAPSQTSDHSSPGDPAFLSPKHTGPFSPSPKKNIQSPFSSPTGPSKLPIQSDLTKIQTSQSDGSKVSTSQSDASSTGTTSQSEGDDALVFPSPGKLTSAVQVHLPHGHY